MSWDEPATGRQLHSIAILAQIKGIKEPIEDREMSRGEARELIYRLRKEGIKDA